MQGMTENRVWLLMNMYVLPYISLSVPLLSGHQHTVVVKDFDL